ncbi:MAG: hypothetical protein ACQEP4_05140 [Bacillota bacterium]
MKRNDFLKNDIEKIFDEKAAEMEFTNQMMESVLNKTTRSNFGKLRRILNYELQIPLVPAAVGIAALLAISILPEGILEKQNNFTSIDIAGSQVLIQQDREVTKR